MHSLSCLAGCFFTRTKSRPCMVWSWYLKLPLEFWGAGGRIAHKFKVAGTQQG
jgi:hypothetical protein